MIVRHEWLRPVTLADVSNRRRERRFRVSPATPGDRHMELGEVRAASWEEARERARWRWPFENIRLEEMA